VADLRLGLVGCGRIAERGYLPALRRARGVRLTAVADHVAAQCERVAPGVAAFPDADALLDARVVDAVVLATPAVAHLADARLAVAAAVPVLVEKPPAPTAREAEELAALDPVPFMGFNRRFEPPLRKLREEIAVPAELRLVLQRRRTSWPSPDPVALDLGPHLVDLALWLTGAPDAADVRGVADDEKLTMELELADGRGTASIVCALGKPYRERIEARGVGGFTRGGLWAAMRARESPLVESLALQLEALPTAVREGAANDLATAHDGVRVMRILERVTS
jgi:myo-inositol 2-dehydrogenase / D-chiro-inositol 1-dehydrogenase